MRTLRILIVDDDAGVRGALRSLLSLRSDWSICGEAADGLEAIECAKGLRPDVVLMDVSMPGLDGLRAAESIRRDAPGCEVVIISRNDPAIVGHPAQALHRHWFVAKSDLGRELIPTIDRIVADRQNKLTRRVNEQQGASPGKHAGATRRNRTTGEGLDHSDDSAVGSSEVNERTLDKLPSFWLEA